MSSSAFWGRVAVPVAFAVSVAASIALPATLFPTHEPGVEPLTAPAASKDPRIVHVVAEPARKARHTRAQRSGSTFLPVLASPAATPAGGSIAIVTPAAPIATSAHRSSPLRRVAVVPGKASTVSRLKHAKVKHAKATRAVAAAGATSTHAKAAKTHKEHPRKTHDHPTKAHLDKQASGPPGDGKGHEKGKS